MLYTLTLTYVYICMYVIHICMYVCDVMYRSMYIPAHDHTCKHAYMCSPNGRAQTYAHLSRAHSHTGRHAEQTHTHIPNELHRMHTHSIALTVSIEYATTYICAGIYNKYTLACCPRHKLASSAVCARACVCV